MIAQPQPFGVTLVSLNVYLTAHADGVFSSQPALGYALNTNSKKTQILNASRLLEAARKAVPEHKGNNFPIVGGESYWFTITGIALRASDFQDFQKGNTLVLRGYCKSRNGQWHSFCSALLYERGKSQCHFCVP